MKLSHLTNKILLADIKKMVGNERRELLIVLHYLKEIDTRKLYCDVKCGSLFDFCTKELGYCESSAQRRIVASRLLRELPQVEAKIAAGTLSLTNISQVNHFFRKASAEEKLVVLEKMENLSKKECEKKLFELTGKKISSRDRAQRVSETETEVSIVLSDKTIDLLEQVKKLLGKNLSHDELLAYMAEAAISKIEKEKFKVVRKDRHSLPPENAGRVPSARVKREVYLRDKSCTNCGSTHRLNFDHRVAYAVGGENSIENIRLLCFECNQPARIRMNLGKPSKESGARDRPP